MITAIITGSRDWPFPEMVEAALVASGCQHVVQGGCPTGADKHARAWALANNIRSSTFKADWNKHGKAAGPIRNREMLQTFQYDPEAVVLAFRLNNSRGTTSAIEIGRELNMPVYVKDATRK